MYPDIQMRKMGKAHALFIDKQLAEKLEKINSHREGAHIPLHVSKEYVSRTRNMLLLGRVTS